MKQILLLDNYDSFTFNLLQLLYGLDCREVDVIRNDKIALSDVASYKRVIISPGPGIPEEAGSMFEVIKCCATLANKPLLGVCLGHQGIAETFGGTLRNLKQVVHGKACKTLVKHRDGPLFKGLPAEFYSGRYHSWVVNKETLPNCLEITAEDESGEIMALRHKELKIFGVQFHPESILTEYGAQILKNWLEC